MNFERALFVFKEQMSCTKGDPLGIVLSSNIIASVEEAEQMLQINDRIRGIPIPEKIRATLEQAVLDAESVIEYIHARDIILRVPALAALVGNVFANDLREQIIALGKHQHMRTLIKILEDVSGEQLVDFHNGTVTMFFIRKFLKVYFRALGRYISQPQSYEEIVDQLRVVLLGKNGREGLLFFNDIDNFLRTVEHYCSYAFSEDAFSVFKYVYGFLVDISMTHEQIAEKMGIDCSQVTQLFSVVCTYLSIDGITYRECCRQLFCELGFSRIESQS